MANMVGRSGLVGGVLAAAAGLALAVSPMLVPSAASPNAVAAVRASAGTDIAFEVLPASPTASPTGQPTRQPTPPTPRPTGSHLPVTSGDGGTGLWLAGLGGLFLLVGWLMVARPSRRC
jgi:hypothetical protein